MFRFQAAGKKTTSVLPSNARGGAIRILVFPGDGKQVAPDLNEELEAERERIGRLLHDEVGQLLYAARLNLQHFLSQHQAHLGDITPTK